MRLDARTREDQLWQDLPEAVASVSKVMANTSGAIDKEKEIRLYSIQKGFASEKSRRKFVGDARIH